MDYTFRHYRPLETLSGDYDLVRSFLLAQRAIGYSYARWDWMVTHSMLDREALGRIGLWEAGGEIAALAAYDTRLGSGYYSMREGTEPLKREVFRYAAESFGSEGRYAAVIPDADAAMQRIALEEGFVATPEKEEDAVHYPPGTDYALPEGFRVTSLDETYDLAQYLRVLYKGFNHEEREGPFVPPDAERLDMARRAMERPNVDLRLKVAAVAPDGNFAAYCGMWYDPAADFAIVEPVATDPAYRRLGLGRAVVLEGVRRCYERGAKRAFVGSSQQFYYSIGFRPHGMTTATLWRRREALGKE